MSWNLPDGVTGNMVPGDRPEDVLAQKAWEMYENELEAIVRKIRDHQVNVIYREAEENVRTGEQVSEMIRELASDLHNETGGLIRKDAVLDRIRELL